MRHALHRGQRGISMLVVLVLLAVMLLGGLGLARLSETSTHLAGNVSFKERAVQAAEVGYATAYQEVQSLSNEDSDSAPWYYATALTPDADGMPRSVNWSATPEIAVGAFSVRYVVERVCSEPPGDDVSEKCLVRKLDPGREGKVSSAIPGTEPLEFLPARQFRVTIRVTGPKNTVTFVQGMVTRS